MRDRDNGQYPYHYKEMIKNIFGTADKAIEECSNSVKGNSNNLTTVDNNPNTYPQYVADGQDMRTLFTDERFDRWYCDPPYNEENALKMYDCRLPNFQKLLKEGARVVKPGSLMFFLIGNQNYQICPPEIERIGMIFMTVVPNNELHCLNIYRKKHAFHLNRFL